jgi:uncharacterized protein HemX
MKVRFSRSKWAEVRREEREPRVFGSHCQQGSAGQLVKTVILAALAIGASQLAGTRVVSAKATGSRRAEDIYGLTRW